MSALLMLSQVPAHAQFIFTITQPDPVPAGGTAFFGARMLNLSVEDFVFDSISFNYNTPADAYLISNADPFYDGTVPDFLGPFGGSLVNSYQGPLFSMAPLPATPIGNYDGDVTVTGHARNATSYDTVQPFRVTVVPPTATVPEVPAGISTSWLLATIGLVALRAKRRARHLF